MTSKGQKPLDLDDAMAELRKIRTRELQEKYREVFGEGTRSSNRVYLLRRIAWGLQMKCDGDLSEQAKARVKELARMEDLRISAPRTTGMSGSVNAMRDKRLPCIGSILRKTYKGRKIEVRITEQGFEWEGTSWRSLSALAREITGGHWSGFSFFRLDKRGPS